MVRVLTSALCCLVLGTPVSALELNDRHSVAIGLDLSYIDASGYTSWTEGSVGKLAQSNLYMAIWEACSEVMGDEALVYEPGYELRQEVGIVRDRRLSAKYQLLRSRANSIEGGTSEIRRNILGERVLGLPGEPRVDKEIPWKDVPRG